jgi:hypothetical protein
MASAWAVLHALGDEGLADAVRRCVEATDCIVAAVAAIPGLRVAAEPDSTLIALAADHGAEAVDPFVLADRMRDRGWVIQPQPAYAGLPRTAHLTVQPASLATVDAFVADLAAAAAVSRVEVSADPGLVELAGQIDPAVLGAADIAGLLEVAGLGGDAAGLPDESAAVHALIEALPTALRDRLLAGFISGVFTADRSA